MSTPPNVSSAHCTIAAPPAGVATESALATASPPAARISATTSSAADADPPVPSTAPPRSLTTTCAPRRASSSAWLRPSPPPAPVTTATRPSKLSGSMAAETTHPNPRTRMDALGGTRFRSIGSALAPPLESSSAARKRSGSAERGTSAVAKAGPKRSEKRARTDEQERLSGWQQRAPARSLDEAKRRAPHTTNGFVQAAMELLPPTGALNFTLQDVVDRSKLSLRSFYQTFASKDDLLLALFEEYVATAADWQRDRMAK